MKKKLALILTGLLCLTAVPVTAFAEESAGEFSLDPLAGTYTELFPEFVKEEYYDWWMECINVYAEDDETAEMYYSMLTDGYMGRLTGQEAIDTYTEETGVFDCYFENDLSKLTFDGDTISGTDADGNELFSHTYYYDGDIAGNYAGMVFDDYFHVVKTDAEDAGIFTYFVFTDDTPEGEFHIEYRYGDNLDELGIFIDGEYAYWMPSGILADYDEDMIHDCIKLFVDENLGGEDASEEVEEAS